MPARVLARERIVEAVPKHAVMDLSRAHAVAPATALHQVGSPVHILHATGNRGFDFSGRDLLRCRDNGLRTGAADAIDSQSRNRDRHAATDCGLADRMPLVAGLNDVAHDHAADVGPIELAAFERLTHHGCTEISGRNRLERAVEGSDSGAHRLAKYDFT